MASPHTPLPLIGQRLGPYLLQTVLGRGGMGQVYGARDTLLERDVALKLLWQGDAETLVREGRAMAAIDHPGVVRIHGIDTSGPRSFVVMERIQGQSLADVLDETPLLPPRNVLAILQGAAVALDAIHAAGRVHGDIKPENVLIERGTNRVVLTDLGLSRALARKDSGRGGTPAYMAPERADGTTTDPALWPREDVYSLAVMAYELLAGRLPFDGADYLEVLRHQSVSLPARPSDVMPSLPWRVDHALLVGLAKRPQMRHPSATAFVGQLERALSRRGGPRVLIADDDEDHARLLSARLAKRLPGAVVCSVGCGRTAYELTRQDRPDALITDLQMPGMNGLELLACVRDERALTTLPRIVVSGRAKPRDFDVLARLGVVGAFHKPVDADGLAKLLRDALHIRPARRASGVNRRVDARAPTEPDVKDAGRKAGS